MQYNYEEELAPVSRDSIEIKTKWWTKSTNIFCFGFTFGAISFLCLSAIINLTADDKIRKLFLIWQDIPLNVWISVISFVLFIVITYYFKLSKNVR